MKIQVKRKYIFYYWRIIANNHQVLGTSEMYFSKSNALRAAARLGKVLKLPVEVK